MDVGPRELPHMTKADPLRAHLMSLDKAALVTFLLQHADDGFLAKLRLQVARQAPEGPDLAHFRASLKDLLDSMGWEEGTTSADLDDFADSLRELMADGHPKAALELAAEALGGLERVWGRVDSSDVYLGCVATALRKIHYEACRQVRPDPRELAGWVFRMEMANGYGAFDDLVDEYRPLLGAEGLTQLKRIATDVWDGIPPLGPRAKKGHDSQRWAITNFMLALTNHDAEAHVAVLQRDLSGPSEFLNVAQYCQASGWPDRAIEWAEKGIHAFPGKEPLLCSFLAARYAAAGRLGKGLALQWTLFEADPDLETYKDLVALARRTGEEEVWRQRAQGLIWELFEASRKSTSRLRQQNLDLMVRIHLHEKAQMEALAAARIGGCRHDTWMLLAKGLETKHPGEAVIILQEQLDPIIAPMKPESYRAAVAVLGRIQGLAQRLQQPGLFATTMAVVMTDHGRKKNLVTLIHKAGLA